MARSKQVVCQSPPIDLDPIVVVRIWVVKQTKLAWSTLTRQDYDGWRMRANINFASSRWLVDRYGSWNAVLDAACQDLGIVNPNTGIGTVSPESESH